MLRRLTFAMMQLKRQIYKNLPFCPIEFSMEVELLIRELYPQQLEVPIPSSKFWSPKLGELGRSSKMKD